jgi:hypothetical protein
LDINKFLFPAVAAGTIGFYIGVKHISVVNKNNVDNVNDENPRKNNLDVIFINGFTVFEKEFKEVDKDTTERKKQIKYFNVFQTIGIQLGSTITTIQTH